MMGFDLWNSGVGSDCSVKCTHYHTILWLLEIGEVDRPFREGGSYGQMRAYLRFIASILDFDQEEVAIDKYGL